MRYLTRRSAICVAIAALLLTGLWLTIRPSFEPSSIDCGTPTRFTSDHPGLQCSVVLHTDKIFASGASDGTLQLWTIPGRRGILTRKCHKDSINAILVAGPGNTVITASDDGDVVAWDIDTWTKRFALSHNASVRTIVYRSTTDTLFAGCADGTLVTWRLGDRMKGIQLREHHTAISCLHLVEKHGVLLTARADGSISLRDPATLALVGSFVGHKAPIRASALSPSCDVLATGDDHGNIILWPTRARNVGGATLPPISLGQGAITSMVFHPHLPCLVVGTTHRGLVFLDTESATIMGECNSHCIPPKSIFFVAGGQSLLCCGLGGVVQVVSWNQRP